MYNALSQISMIFSNAVQLLCACHTFTLRAVHFSRYLSCKWIKAHGCDIILSTDRYLDNRLASFHAN